MLQAPHHLCSSLLDSLQFLELESPEWGTIKCLVNADPISTHHSSITEYCKTVQTREKENPERIAHTAKKDQIQTFPPNPEFTPASNSERPVTTLPLCLAVISRVQPISFILIFILSLSIHHWKHSQTPEHLSSKATKRNQNSGQQKMPAVRAGQRRTPPEIRCVP